MKVKLVSILFLIIFLICSITDMQAQCPGCTISLPAGIPADTVLVDTLPYAYKNQYYQEEMSFRLPYTSDPLAAVAPPGTNVPTGLSIDYFEIQSVTGLPPGLAWVGDRTPPMRYDEVSPDTRDGCITLCGIPAAAGTYTINVNLEIQVSGFIFPTPPIPLEFIVYPDTNASFITNTSSGCAPFFVQISNLLPSNGLSGFSYQWDFGNGQSSTLENPDSVEFTLADTGMVAITQTVVIDTFPFMLETIVVTASDCNDDIPFISQGAPDMYIKIFDGSTEIINTDPDFSILGTIDPSLGENNEYAPDTMEFPGPLRLKTTPYLVEVWDDDNAILNGDDQCGGGAISISALDGQGWHSASNGGVSISYFISHYIDTIVYVDSINVENCNVNVAYLDAVERTFMAYPNPTKDQLNVRFDMTGMDYDVTIQLTNILGHRVYQENIQHFSGSYARTLELDGYSSGLYTLYVQLGDRVITRKIIVRD